jgi:NAD dependent epimerase/dehydratase
MNLNNKNVIVTGADGFIGSHLVQALIKEGCKVKAFCYYNSFNSWGWLEEISKEELSSVEIIMGDLRDPNGIRKALIGIDIIFHLGALIAIPFSYVSPDSYIDTNIRGTLNILQASKDANIQKILITSSSEVYGTAQYVPIDEKHPKQPQSPYSATKIGADSLAESFYRSFNLPVTIVRPFNTYGPRQSARAVIPTIITQLLAGSQMIKLGALYPTRDLLYVEDTVQGFVEIAKSDSLIGEEINIATNSEISIGDLAKLIISEINPNAQIVNDHVRMRPEKSEVYRLLGDNQKLLRQTKWNQKYDLEQGLKKTIDWFKTNDHLERYKSNLFNV